MRFFLEPRTIFFIRVFFSLFFRNFWNFSFFGRGGWGWGVKIERNKELTKPLDNHKEGKEERMEENFHRHVLKKKSELS